MPDDLFQSPYGLGIPRKRGVLPDARLVDEGVHEGVFRQNVQKSIYRLRGLPSEEGIIDQVQAEPSPVDRHGSARLVEMNPAALEKTRKRTRTREHVPDSENPALANGRAAIRVGRDVPEVQQQVVGGEGLPSLSRTSAYVPTSSLRKRSCISPNSHPSMRRASNKNLFTPSMVKMPKSITLIPQSDRNHLFC